MLDIENNILSLTDFKRNTSDVIKRVKDNKSPAILTVNGSASVVVLDAKEYQKIVKDARYGSLLRGLESGLKDMEQGKYKPASEVFANLKQRLIGRIKRQG